MSRMIKNLMVVLMAAVMFFTSALTPVRAEEIPEEPVETLTEENLEQESTGTGSEDTGEAKELIESTEKSAEVIGGVENENTQGAEVISDTDGDVAIENDFDEVLSVLTKASSSFKALRAGTPEIDKTPDAEKELVPNGDGTSTLSLSITGQAKSQDSSQVSKSNVLIMLDRSNSMHYWTEYSYDEKTYDGETYAYYAYDHSTRVYWDGSKWYYNRYGSTYEYTNAVNVTRLTAAQMAINVLVKELLSKNTAKYPDLIEVKADNFASIRGSYMQFSDGGSIESPWVSGSVENSSNIMQYVNVDYTFGNTYGGTNWQTALEYSKDELTNKNVDDPSTSDWDESTENCFVIFVTDGDPTQYGSGTSPSGSGSSYDTTAQTYANQAAFELLDNTGYTLFSIFAFGSGNNSANHLRQTTYYGYKGELPANNDELLSYDDEYFFDATNITRLMSAFDDIIKNIINSVAYGEVSFVDGISTDVTASTVIEGEATGFKYTVSKGEETLYTVTAHEEDDTLKVVFNVNGTDYDGTEHTDDEGRVYYSAEVNGTEYLMALADREADQVSWDLSAIGTLLDGYTYTVSFTVWPKQEAYDYLAKLNNGLAEWDNTNEQAVEYTDEDGNVTLVVYKNGSADYPNIVRIPGTDGAPDTFSILTNTDQTLNYSIANTQIVDGEPTTTYDPQDPLPLDPAKPMQLLKNSIAIEKAWDISLAPSELQDLVFPDGVYDDYYVELTVKSDGNEYKKFTFPKLGSNGKPVDKDGVETNDADELVWSDKLTIVPGIMLKATDATEKGILKKDCNVVSLNGVEYWILKSTPGHNYTIEETHGSDLHFEYDAITYHPMLVDGELKNVEINGSTAKFIDENEIQSFKGVNTIKGGIDIKKFVGTSSDFAEEVTVGDTKSISVKQDKLAADYNGEFAYTIKLTDADGNPVVTPEDQYELDEEGNLVDYTSGFMAYNVYDENGNRIKRGPITEAVTVLAMPAKGYIRIGNIPSGTKYEVTEIEDSSEVYKYLLTAAETKKGTETTYVESVNTNTYSGTVSGNTSSIINYYNWSDSHFYVYHSKDCTVEKIAFTDKRVKGVYDSAANAYNYEFNIYAETKDETLYGGYYNDWSGKTAGFDALSIPDDEWVDGKYYTETFADEKDRGYTPENVSRYKWTTANTIDGRAMHAEKDHTYFLKEVPECYLRPYTHYTYTKPSLIMTGLWFVSAIDDAKYKQAGFDIVDVKEGITATQVVSSFKVGTTSGIKTTLTAPKVYAKWGLKTGYLAYYNAKAYIKSNTTYVIRQYWITKDGIKVYGVADRTIKFTDKKYTTTVFE